MKNAVSNQLIHILNAREERTALKLKNADCNLHSLTLTLNIPGIPKSNALFHHFFKEIVEELKVYLKSHLIDLSYDNSQFINDDAGDFFILSFTEGQTNPKKLKMLTENFEETHPSGRIIDVDIFSATNGHIGSGKEKICFVCKQHSAVYCMRNKRHNYTEIRKKMQEEISNYLNQKQKDAFIHKMVSLATRSILFEVSFSPKPGLVHYYDAGTHKDMHYYTFLSSSAVLGSYFKDFVNEGYKFSGKWEQALPIIRQIGLKAEKEMFTATNGVNTQKGLIFIFGISLFSYGYLFARQLPFSEKNFRKIVKKFSHNLVINELENTNKSKKTHGEKVYAEYGLGGIRQETASGFATVFDTAIPYLNENFKDITKHNQTQINQILQNALLKIMAVNNDTNVLYRSDLARLQKLKELSRAAVNDKNRYEELNNFCNKHRISPGGSADLLALSLLIHYIKKQKNKK
ncbi:MAG: triphosphoribosyl-dephospho-CoA synthase [Bacteroidales bacterium]|nr:triphosphoribosyl-dephospho-CoA synthase [Bacteroidales bacterium]